MNLPRLVWAFIIRRPREFPVPCADTGAGRQRRARDRAAGENPWKPASRADLGGVDLVIGAKGSPLQVILSALLEVDHHRQHCIGDGRSLRPAPAGKAGRPRVPGRQRPRGVRIVGTQPRHADLYGAHLASGSWWTTSMQAVLGADAARRLGYRPGSIFLGEHG